MDSEGQTSNSSAVFTSEAIGNKATPEYFQNVKGGKKNKEKVEKKRTRITRKTLFIALGVVAAILVVVILVFVIINLVNNSKYGERTGEDLPTTISEVEQRAYAEAYKIDGEVDYAKSLYYVNDLIKDMVDSSANKNLIFATRAFRAILAYQAGGHDAGLEEAVSLLELASTEREKFIIYGVLDRLYILEENWDEAQRYEDMMDELDVEENRQGTKSGFGSAEESYANDLTEGGEDE